MGEINAVGAGAGQTTGYDRTLKGFGWMVLATLCFVAITGIVRHLGSDLPAAQGAFIRYVFGLLILLPFAGPVLRRPPGRREAYAHVLRGLVHGAAVLLWFYAMARIPITEVTAIGYAAPVFAALGAVLFLGEQLKLHRAAAIAAGFAGTLVILRPGFQEISAGHLAQLVAAPCFAVSFLLGKWLTSERDALSIVFMLSVGCTLFLLPTAILQWRDPTWDEVGWLAVTAVVATAGHWAMTRAFACAPLTVTQPIQFLQLVWAVILGMAVFGEPLDPYVILGGAIVVGSATAIAHMETRGSHRVRRRIESG